MTNFNITDYEHLPRQVSNGLLFPVPVYVIGADVARWCVGGNVLRLYEIKKHADDRQTLSQYDHNSNNVPFKM